MSEIKWIKITTDIFDDEKILLIESLPDADALIVIWFKLLCLAGKQNNSGVFLINDRIPYTDKMLATIFRRKEPVVQLALKTFEQFGMIEMINGVITIPNWNKHQTLDAYEKKKERDRQYQAKLREKQRLLLSDKSPDNRLTSDDTSPKIVTLEEDKEKEKDKDIYSSDFSAEKSAEKMPTFQTFIDLYHELCPSFPRVQKLTEGRKTAIKARWTEYPNIDTFKKVFTSCENNPFMKGNNDRNWVANFDFIFQASSFTKIVEGYYDNLGKPTTPEKPKPKNAPLEGKSFDPNDFFKAATNRKYGG